MQTEVLIAGAGPTGLMLAVWLTRLGVRVHIADRKSGPVQETRAIAVQARTLELYDQLGLGAQVMAQGRPFDRVNLFAGGTRRAQVSLHGLGRRETPHPYLVTFTQDQNEALLVAELARLGVGVAWNTEVGQVTQDPSGVRAVLTRAGQSGTVQARYVAACDGAGSAVRKSLGIAMSGGTYARRFYVADVRLSGPVVEGEVNFTLEDRDFLAIFPMPQPGRFRIVGQLPAGSDEHTAFGAVRPQIEASGLARITALHWFSSYRVHHRVADHFRLGRAFVLGDAGHVHTPVGGQGMNTGLGDAVNLAWKLAQAVQGHAEALDTYGPERRPFALALVNTTDRAFTAVVSTSPLARVLRTQVLPRALPWLSRPAWVRRALFLTLSQIRLHYRRSPLSWGQAGRVRGGQRLPWVPQPGGGSNFRALQSLRWQVHVYGTPGPEVLGWCAQHDLPLHAFVFGRAARQAGLARDAVYLIRPDGHVGLCAPAFDAALFGAYAARWVPRSGDRSTAP